MKSKLFLLLTTNFVSLSKSLQEEVYRDFFNLVYGVSMHMIRDHSAAEDIVQEAFMKTIYNAPTFQNEQQLLGWIKVVTKNLSLNLIRKNKRIRNQDDIEVKDYTKGTLYQLNRDEWTIRNTSGDLYKVKNPLNKAREYIYGIVDVLKKDKNLIQLEGKYRFHLILIEHSLSFVS